MRWQQSKGNVTLKAMKPNPSAPFSVEQEKKAHKTKTTFKIGKTFVFIFSFSWSSFGPGAINSGKEF